jgi:hypothetical protein
LEHLIQINGNIYSSLVKNNENIAAKPVVYAGDEEEYFTFMTLEAYSSIKEWMNFRESHGEKITRESWIMRDL